MSILVNAGDGNSIFDIAAKFQNMELREMKKQPDTIKSNRKAGLDTGSSDFNTKLGDIEAMFSQLNYKIETINTRRPAPQYLITISQSIPNILLNLNKEVNALVKASKSKATKWATELSDDDKDDIRFNMDNLTTIKNNLKESGQMSDFKTQYKKLTELVEKDLEPIVQRLTGKSYTKPQAQPAGPAGQAGPMTPSPSRRQSPDFTSPISRSPMSPSRSAQKKQEILTKAGKIMANPLERQIKTNEQLKSDVYKYFQAQAKLRKMDTAEFDALYTGVTAILGAENSMYGTLTDLIGAIGNVSKGYQQNTQYFSPSPTSGAGKYSSQAKHYLSQDYYTFVDTMPKKRFL